MPSTGKRTKLEIEIAEILNKYSEENRSDTPDWILSLYLVACLDAFNSAMFSREVWYGKNADEIFGRLKNPREEAPELWKSTQEK